MVGLYVSSARNCQCGALSAFVTFVAEYIIAFNTAATPPFLIALSSGGRRLNCRIGERASARTIRATRIVAYAKVSRVRRGKGKEERRHCIYSEH